MKPYYDDGNGIVIYQLLNSRLHDRLSHEKIKAGAEERLQTDSGTYRQTQEIWKGASKLERGFSLREDWPNSCREALSAYWAMHKMRKEKI